MAIRFKDSKQKFSGNIGEFLSDYVSEYLQAARDYNLGNMQKLQFMHNILAGDAKKFYYNRFNSYVASFPQAVSMLLDEFNSHVRHGR